MQDADNSEMEMNENEERSERSDDQDLSLEDVDQEGHGSRGSTYVLL